MAEVLRSFEAPLSDETGTAYRARVVGGPATDGLWEGWLEFVPADGSGDALVTSVESRQPKRSDLLYWATGLTPVYAEGALARARNPLTITVPARETPEYDAPAPPLRTRPAPSPGPEAILDPFEIGERSIDILRQELAALNRPRLLNIIAAYDLNPAGEDLSGMTDRQLVHFITVAVEARLTR